MKPCLRIWKMALLAVLGLLSSGCEEVSTGPTGKVGIPACIEYGRYLHWEGSLILDGEIRDLLVAGNRAYAAVDDRIEVFDLSAPGHPRHVGGVAGRGNVNALSVMGDRLVSAGTALETWDLSGTELPRLLGRLEPGPFTMVDVATAGPLASAVGRSGDLVLADLSDPRRPRELGRLQRAGFRAVTLDGAKAYVTGFDSLWTVDVSNPFSPRMKGLVYLFGGGREVAVRDEYAFVAGFDLEVVDVSDPSSPV
jgi:hypothetical protein